MKLARAAAAVLTLSLVAAGSPAGAVAPREVAQTTAAAAERRLCSGAEPVGTGPCPGVRPGGLIDTDEGGCTLNFVFRDAKGRRYAGTAGHCTLTAPGEAVWKWGAGPQVEDGDGNPIGRFVYAFQDGSRDFALIRLYDWVEADPEMCHFGGPTGIDSSTRTDPFVVQFFGNGSGIGNLGVINQTTLPARSAVAPEMTDPHEVLAAGLAIGGDSGAAVTEADGDRAIGVLVATQGQGVIVIARLRPLLRKAETALGTALTLLKP